MNISRSMTQALIVAGLAVLLAACGGSQEPDEEPVVAEEQPSCISERWARPPEQIGQTPPEEFPPSDAIEPFESSRGTSGEEEAPAAPESSP